MSSTSSSSSSSDQLFRDSENIVEETICQSKYFQPRCSEDEEVLVMERARYGRMEMSRCVKENFGFIGCSNDVLEVLDRHCSGRPSCSVRVLDENFYRRRPCHEDLKSYLAVEYRCVKVISWNRHCLLPPPVTLNLTRGFLSSPFPISSACGSAAPSWILLAKRGQNFKISLLDFSPEQESKGAGTNQQPEASTNCQSYGRIVELEEDHTGKGGKVVATPVCGGGSRMKVVLVSKSHALEVQILPPSLFRVNNPSFLIAFQVMGCPDVEPPQGGWNQRNADVLLIGCSKTSDTWFMHCSDLEWKGEMGNCSTPWGSLQGVQRDRPSYFFPGAAMISFMTFCIGIIIVLTGASLLKRRWRWWHEMLTPSSGENVYDPKFHGTFNRAINQHSSVSYGISGNSDVLHETRISNNNNNNDNGVSHHLCQHHHHHRHRDPSPSPPLNPLLSKPCCSCDASLVQLLQRKQQASGHVVIELVQSSDRRSSVSLASVKNDVKQIYLL